jgi:nucleoid DNA-binding protein
MQVYTAIQYFYGEILVALEDEVFLVEFSRFRKANIAAKNGRNPKTGESIKIPAHNTTKIHGRNKT